MTDAVTNRTGSRRPKGILPLIFGAGPLDRVEGAPAWILSLALLAARIYLAVPFWNAGQARLANWDSQAWLFDPANAEFGAHPLPLLSPMQAAYITTFSELALPILLILGLLGRFAGLGLGVMAATIFFVIGGIFAIAQEQFPWMALGLLIFLVGPGRLSADYAIRRFLLRG